jgi:VWFA-related protein
VSIRIATLVLVLGGLAAGNQQPTFRTRIDLVQVDVVVVDKAGNPVRGLTATDFAVFDRKKPQAVATFDEISREIAADVSEATLPEAVKRDVASNQTAQSGRLVVMVIDDLHIWKDRTERAKEIARKVLTDLGDQSSMAVLFTSGDHSTLVTEDRSMLSTAVETFKARQSWRRPHAAVDGQKGKALDPEMSSEQQLGVIQQSQDTKAQDFFDNMRQYKTLQDASRLLGSGDARRKAFVLISEGIGKDLSGLFGAMAPPGEVPEGGVAYATGGGAAATMAVAPTSYHDFALIDMMEAMRRSNVATYAIDPRGRVESKDLTSECFPAPSPGQDPCSNDMADWYSPVRMAQHGLQIMSDASGGFAVTNTDDFTSGLKKIVDDLDHYYLLGFYPSDQKGKGYRPLDVRMPGHPDWKLRFRHGYMPGGPPPAPKNSNAMVALSAGVLPKTDLPLRLTAIPLPSTAPGMTTMALALEVTAPPASLQETDGKLRDTLKYEVLVVDEKKARVRSLVGLEGRLTLSPSTTGQALPPTIAYQVGETFDLPPGHYELRVSAVSQKLSKGGSVYLDVDVPDLRAGALQMSGIVMTHGDGPRVPVAPPSARGGPSPLPFPPSLDRVFASDDALRVYFEGSARTTGRVGVAIEVVNASGKVVSSPSPSFTSGDPIRVQGMVPLGGLTPGAYILRASLADGSRSATRETAFVIR